MHAPDRERERERTRWRSDKRECQSPLLAFKSMRRYTHPCIHTYDHSLIGTHIKRNTFFYIV